MDDIPQGQRQSTLFGKLAILVVLLILGVALFGEKGVVRLIKLMHEREHLAQEVQRLKEENDRLRHTIEALRSDQRYLEQLARKELGMVREDEMVFQFRPAKEPPATEASGSGGEH